MWIDATIAFGGIILLGVVGFTLHWWLGRRERLRREQRDAERAPAASR